ncbi:hypothetical protein TCAL_00035 [Tigriopus californicus]|uniref:Vesicle transport protein n=1 Tax=Tigriopus californicus TaxID=6832 RepID=A0A553PFD0_TIGCA|nr:vesicle transport protein SFT2C-like [Tigriopus californicus]TRY76405.1 hypothetical protein TCAL_00035 [Tigriopus californicus]|eukprot:TCALIF_00035-PA protein Name:"Similar to SFT2 Protein transport protein SFT2 (Saccharomyces cerevisiae (strain ATCC 204508 / S288c))" AED:0.19 eAED:0.19 QI:0/-1/0/1/-1/1/1/0/236
MANLKADLDSYLKTGGSNKGWGSAQGLSLPKLSQGWQLPTLKSPFSTSASSPSSRSTAGDTELLMEEGAFSTDKTGVSGWFPNSKNECCPSLTKRQRIVGFMLCLSMGVLCFGLASLYTPVLILYARKFALLFSLGSVFTLGSFSLLWGPVNHFKHLTSSERWPFTAVYTLTLVGTLYFSMGLQSTVLTVIAAVGQVMALLWFVISYIPGGQTGLAFFSKLCSSFCRSTVGNSLPV